jgi:hypothetical protein
MFKGETFNLLAIMHNGPSGLPSIDDEHTDDHTSPLVPWSFGCPLALYCFAAISE